MVLKSPYENKIYSFGFSVDDDVDDWDCDGGHS